MEVVELKDDEEEDVVQEDEPAPAMGWATKFYYKPGCESSISHHRLKGILIPTTLIGTRLWSMSAMSILTL